MQRKLFRGGGLSPSFSSHQQLGAYMCSDESMQSKLPCPAKLHCERTGVGPPLVATHGVGSSSKTWAGQVPVFSQHFEVTSWDLRGHGSSERPEDPNCYSRDAALGDLADVVLGAASEVPAVLIGHSLGGYLSMALAITQPSLVKTLVLIATGPGFRDPEARDQWNAGMDKMAASFDLPGYVAGIAEQPDALVMDGLASIKAPTLLIVGERDKRYHGGCSYLERKLGARLVMIEGGGHMVHETHAEEVNKAIEAFLVADA